MPLRITDEMLSAEKRFFAARRGLEDAARRGGFEIQSILGDEVTYAPLRLEGAKGGRGSSSSGGSRRRK